MQKFEHLPSVGTWLKNIPYMPKQALSSSECEYAKESSHKMDQVFKRFSHSRTGSIRKPLESFDSNKNSHKSYGNKPHASGLTQETVSNNADQEYLGIKGYETDIRKMSAGKKGAILKTISEEHTS